MRLLRDKGGSHSTKTGERVRVRSAAPEDADALARLAELDSVHLSDGPMLLAEVGDRLRAAISLADGTVVADPFHPSAELITRLRKRAAELSD